VGWGAVPQMGRLDIGVALASAWRSRAKSCTRAQRRGRPELAWGGCGDVVARAELDGAPQSRRPRGSGLCQTSCEAHMAWRQLHMASGTVADGASTRAHAHAAGHVAARTGLVGTLLDLGITAQRRHRGWRMDGMDGTAQPWQLALGRAVPAARACAGANGMVSGCCDGLVWRQRAQGVVL
jgi:hypothetical protein